MLLGKKAGAAQQSKRGMQTPAGEKGQMQAIGDEEVGTQLEVAGE